MGKSFNNRTWREFKHEREVRTLQEVGNANRSRQIPSGRDKANNPRRQRREWRNALALVG